MAAVIALLDGLRLQWFFTDRSGSIADQVRTTVDAYLGRLPKGPEGPAAREAVR